MDRTRARDVKLAIRDASRRADSAGALEKAVATQVARAVPFDLWCGLLTDPNTGHPTGGFHDEGLPADKVPRLVEIENGAQQDFVAIRSLAADSAAARTLDEATGGDPARSERYRDVLAPAGVRHELRTVFRTDSGTWGALVLMRGSDERDFSSAELALVESLSATVADGLRRVTVLGRYPDGGLDGPGLVVCSVGRDRIAVDHANPAAREWLAEIEDGHSGGVPYAVAALAHSALHDSPAHGQHRARMRTRAGRWLTVYAERLGASTVSVIIEPTRPAEIAALLCDAFRLTARERDVAMLAVRGHTNAQIAALLFLSAFTVQDHLKAAFAKAGVSSRTELAARLYFDHSGQP